MTPVVSSTSGGYRWTCPYCGRSRINRSGGDAGRANAIAAVRTHVLASDGDGHGPKHAYPDGSTGQALAEHVVEVNGRD